VPEVMDGGTSGLGTTFLKSWTSKCQIEGSLLYLVT